MLKVSGTLFADGSGKVFPLHGFALGTWMMLENVMLGFPGLEQHFRQDLLEYAGKEKSDFFWENFLNDFVQEADIRFLGEIGCNVIRLPFNYRYFESDTKPFVYNINGFHHMDRLIGYCKKYGIRVILDMHSLPGFQNKGWHSDNPTGEIRLFLEPHYQERTRKLWQFIAEHYKNEDAVAGYELLNEPDAVGKEAIKGLNQVYRDTVKAIREVDKEHIIFLEGNTYGRTFAELDEPFADQLAYSCHYYGADPSVQLHYPVESGMNKSLIAAQIYNLASFAQKHKVPLWVGEFASNTIGDLRYLTNENQFLSDQLEIFNSMGLSWTFWSYKTIPNWGTVTCTSDSPWMQMAAPFLTQKKKYNCDFDGSLYKISELGGILKPLYYDDFRESDIPVDAIIQRDLASAFSRGLINVFAKELAKLPFDDLKQLTGSFRFENCVQYENWLTPIRKHLK